MPTMKQILDPDSKLALESVRFMAETPDAVEAMTRTQLYLHMDIRERMLKARHGADWQRHFDAEMAEKRAHWAAARDLHEIEKALRRTR